MYDSDNNYSAAPFDQDSGTYHYSYVPPRPQPQPPKKKHGALKVIALLLCAALIGGGAGVGGAALYNSLTAPAAPPAPEVVIYRNDTPAAPVQVQRVDGVTPMSLSEIYAAFADSCVCVTVQAVIQQGRYQYNATSSGSGFILSEDGYVVTNYHVIDGARAIKITLNNGEQYDASLIGGEETNDVAVLKIEGITGLTPVVLGDSDTLVVGETVCTIGNALGTLSFSQTSGGVSAVGRAVAMSDGTVINMIQTDCTINSGNSGGPLFDSYGRVVGITSAKYSNNGDSSQAAIEGIGFAIPINDVDDIISDYIQYGYVTGRPYMGISAADVTEQYQQAFGWPVGVYVNSVEQNSCAYRAGIRQGDILTKIGDTDITGVNQMISVKNSYRAGDTVSVTLFRAGETFSVSLTFDEQNSTVTEVQPAPQESSQPSSGNGFGDLEDFLFDPWSFFFGH